MLDEKTMQTDIARLETKISELEGKRSAAVEDLEQKRDETIEKLNQKIKETKIEFKEKIVNTKEDFDDQMVALKLELKQRNATLAKLREVIGEYESIGTSDAVKPAKKKKKDGNTKKQEEVVQPTEQPVAEDPDEDQTTSVQSHTETEAYESEKSEDPEPAETVENTPRRSFFGGF